MKKTVLVLLATFAFSQFLVAQDDSFIKDSCSDPVEEVYFQQELNANMDRMLDLWYVKREVSNSHSILSKLKDDTTAIEDNDSIVVARLSKISTVIPLGYNEQVKRWIELYVDKRKRSSSAMLGLAKYYFPWMQEVFDKYGVPEELIYLTIIESSLNPIAVSPAGATGIWQFMYTTGKMYGLDVNTFIDDRRDPYKATDAAARHLRDLHEMFNDWGLAIAAYNCGPANVRKAIQRSGGKQDFWGVCRYLPKETQSYFPAYIAALYLMKYHNQYGIMAADIAIPSNVDTVMINKELHLEQLAHVLNIDIEEIKTLNPQYKRMVIPAYEKPYPLRLRMQDIIRYLDMKDSVHAFQYDTYFAEMKVYQNIFTGKEDATVQTKKIYHTVKKGESLSKIASKYHLSLYELKKMNRLKSNYIKPKQRLLVGYKQIVVPNTSSETPKITPTDSTFVKSPVINENDSPVENPTYYIVKKGDSLYAIASKFKVDVKKLAAYNGIKNMNQISVGQKLKIPR